MARKGERVVWVKIPHSCGHTSKHDERKLERLLPEYRDPGQLCLQCKIDAQRAARRAKDGNRG